MVLEVHKYIAIVNDVVDFNKITIEFLYFLMAFKVHFRYRYIHLNNSVHYHNFAFVQVYY